jgi:hypothetical protein
VYQWHKKNPHNLRNFGKLTFIHGFKTQMNNDHPRKKRKKKSRPQQTRIKGFLSLTKGHILNTHSWPGASGSYL